MITYLQPFYFTLESVDVVFHVATVQALLALFFRSRWSLHCWTSNFFSFLDYLWLPLLGQSDWLSAFLVVWVKLCLIRLP